MKYGIVAFPSKQLQDFANSYRKRYDSHYTKITPHITLKGVTVFQELLKRFAIILVLLRFMYQKSIHLHL